LEHAQRILTAAEGAARAGSPSPAATFVISPEGGLQMLAAGDGPLDSLLLDRGAAMAYRVARRGGHIEVEGVAPGRRCLFTSVQANPVALLLRT
jgi:hypothetical protein